MAVRSRHLSVCLALCLATPLCAQELAPGDYRLEGREDQREPISVVLQVRGEGASLQLERTATKVDDDDGLRRPRTRHSRSVRWEGNTLHVVYTAAARGMAARLDPDDDEEDDRLNASYYLSEDGLRLYESTADRKHTTYAVGRLDHPALELVREAKIVDLVGDKLEEYEASGVVTSSVGFHVVFDNSTRIARIDADLQDGELIKTEGRGASNFEGLTRDRSTGRFFALIEYARHDGGWAGRVWELDEDLERERNTRLRGLELPGNNKGFEGLAFVRRNDRDYLLALPEGNHGRGDRRARDRGNGLIEVFKLKRSNKWEHKETIELPEAALFSDYSGIDVRNGRIAVVSQTSSLVWIGDLETDDWTVDQGRIYRFPRAGSQILYASIEGVALIDDRTLVAVSDSHDDRTETSESIHVFRLPE